MRVSVVVPALDEAERIGACLASVAGQRGPRETVVADGGSRDATRAIAGRAGARVVASAPGRGVQMNAGARAATGDVLLFLHADTRLAPGALGALRGALGDPRVVGGTFTLRFDADHPMLRLYSAFTRLKPRVFHYGDQGIFVRRDVFEAIGGFHEWPLMEDIELLRRMRRAGAVTLVDPPVTTSARRFVRTGPVRQQLLNTALVALFYLGASPTALARWYRAREH